MKTLTINLPDSIDPEQALWTLARSLYESGELTLEQAASLAELAPTYFKMKLDGILTNVKPTVSHTPKQSFDPERVNALAKKMDIQESWEELVAMIGK